MKSAKLNEAKFMWSVQVWLGVHERSRTAILIKILMRFCFDSEIGFRLLYLQENAHQSVRMSSCQDPQGLMITHDNRQIILDPTPGHAKGTYLRGSLVRRARVRGRYSSGPAVETPAVRNTTTRRLSTWYKLPPLSSDVPDYRLVGTQLLNNALLPEGRYFWVILAGIKFRWLSGAPKQGVNVQTIEQCNSRAREYRRARSRVAITSTRSSHISTASHEDASTSNFFEARPGCAEVPLLRRVLRRRHKSPQHAKKLRQAA
ncbi:hypothetical protein EDB83DRAFT_2314119 [Lactarius deliciosus]|nr:hypothetical protein EDB83DRAFT_2314119 [Lactarius deliciosus]